MFKRTTLFIIQYKYESFEWLSYASICEYDLMKYMNYSETWLNQPLNKRESCIHQTLNKPESWLHQTLNKPESCIHHTLNKPESWLHQTLNKPESWLHQTLNKPESCIHQTLNKVPMYKIFVNLTCIYWTPVYSEHKVVYFRQVPLYFTFFLVLYLLRTFRMSRQQLSTEHYTIINKQSTCI